MESIIQKEKECFICHRNGAEDPLECHHIFYGVANRKHSEEDGMKVWLCGNRCHRNGKDAVHRCRETDLYLKRIAQERWEETYGTREDFLARYGKSYL